MAHTLDISHTADLVPHTLREARALLDDAFAGGFDDHDWDHSLGGLHILVRDEHRLVAHGAVVQRRVRHAGRSLRVGYVEGVGVLPGMHRQGLGGRVMAAAERIVESAYELGGLSASAAGAPLYLARGWRIWPGEVGALGPEGPVRLPDEEGSTLVREVPGGVRLDESHGLLFDWRDGDVL